MGGGWFGSLVSYIIFERLLVGWLSDGVIVGYCVENESLLSNLECELFILENPYHKQKQKQKKKHLNAYHNFPL